MTETQVNLTSTYQTNLLVIDPHAPSQPLATIDLGTSGTLAPIQFSDDNTVDPAARTTTFNRHTLVFFTKGGSVYKIDLRAGQSHDPVRLSSLSNACSLVPNSLNLLPVSADGSDAWVVVSLADGTGSCASGGVATAYIRSTMTASDAPVTLPAGDRLYDALDDGAGNTWAYLVRDKGTLALFGADLSKLATVSGTMPAGNPQRAGTDYTSPHAAYYVVDGTLRRLTWSATSANFEPASYTFHDAAAAAAQTSGISDTSAFYFPDGNNLLAVSGSGSPHTLVTASGLPIHYVLSAGDQLAFEQVGTSGSSSEMHVSIVPKAGGTPTMVSGSTAFPLLLGASVHYVYYSDGSNVHAVALDGKAADTLVNPGAVTFSVALARTRVAENWPIAEIDYCVASTNGDANCSNGQVLEVNADTLASQSIGSITHTTTYPYATLNLAGAEYNLTGGTPTTIAGIPQIASFAVLSSSGNTTISKSDLYVYTPGAAHSWSPVTSMLP